MAGTSRIATDIRPGGASPAVMRDVASCLPGIPAGPLCVVVGTVRTGWECEAESKIQSRQSKMIRLSPMSTLRLCVVG